MKKICKNCKYVELERFGKHKVLCTNLIEMGNSAKFYVQLSHPGCKNWTRE